MWETWKYAITIIYNILETLFGIFFVFIFVTSNSPIFEASTSPHVLSPQKQLKKRSWVTVATAAQQIEAAIAVAAWDGRIMSDLSDLLG